MTKDEIRAAILDLAKRQEEHPWDRQKLRHFAERLSRESDEVVFDALMSFFEEYGYMKGGYARQSIAGTLLALRRPKPAIDLDTILVRSAPNFDLSVRQFPWYLALVFRREMFHQTVRDRMRDLQDGREKRALDTYLYWTRLSEEQMLEKLKAADD